MPAARAGCAQLQPTQRAEALTDAVLDHGGRHVRGGDPDRGEQDRRDVGVGRGVLRGAVDQRRGGVWPARRYRATRRRGLGLEVDRLVDRAALVALQDVLQTRQRGVLAGGRELLGRDLFSFCRTAITALALSSFGVTTALMFGCAVYCWSKVVGRHRGRPGAGRLADLHVGAVVEVRLEHAVVALGEQRGVVVGRVAVHDQDVAAWTRSTP